MRKGKRAQGNVRFDNDAWMTKIETTDQSVGDVMGMPSIAVRSG